MDTRIELLADHPAQVMRLGHWMHEEWPMLGRSVADRAALFMMCMNRDQVPMTFVAMAGGAPAGTVSLLDRSVASHEHLHPWVASLYVGRPWRHGGLATRLVETATAAARRLGVATVYIGVTARARPHYEQQGWRFLGEGQVADDPADRVDVLHRALR
jgi:GNAT superfamily N-acetyltransferase